ncbi:membrane protein [Algimonas ampicilliniresistens]|jgi:O-acetylserine/cysteine efflux transporter|uniref:Membrane protein n=1 Tax=Algimonas ampicilliniresistens TaxID=1298735 RepID=A0ABQ5V7M0_9PROT|nr:EamA family transporter [Algimonas ampicilliniresistens]GLQ22655.1 membrane protein [Algimonas ampicilliniresistens]
MMALLTRSCYRDNMNVRETLVLLMICTIWGLHFSVMRTAIGDFGMPPLFYAAMRMSLVAILMSPFLRWHKGQMRAVFIGGLGFGALNYAFMFPAMGMTTASAAAVAIELYMPFSVLLGVLLLGERIRGWSSLGIALAFLGVIIIAIAGPREAVGPLFIVGLALIACGALSEAFAAIAVKRTKGIKPSQLVAWFAVIGTIILWPLTLVLETNQTAVFAPDLRWMFLAALAYSTLLVSILAHGSYYWLLSRLPIQVVAPSGLLNTVIGVAGGLIILREPLSLGLILGVAVTMSGVGIVIWRSTHRKKIETEMVTPTP